MPKLSQMMFHVFGRAPQRALLAILLVIAASCASTNQEPVVSDGPEYGDSLDEFLDASGADADAAGASSGAVGFREIQWEELTPPGSSSAEISARYRERIDAVEPGSAESDELYAEMQAEYTAAYSVMNPDIAGESVQLAGFVAPLTYSDDNITEFLLVPYFGACIHVPPPPPNQTVMVTLEEGQSLTIEESWGAVWVTGTLDVETSDTDLATAGYTIAGAQTGVHEQY